MKKTFSILSMLALFFFFANAASAQISELKFENNSNCPVTVRVNINDANCQSICSSASVTVPANTLISIPLNCFGTDRGSSVEVQIMDNQSTATVGTGCGLPTSAGYLDCMGGIRTLSMLAGNYAAVN